MQLPTPTVINQAAKVSEYLAGNDIAKGRLFGRKIMPNLNKVIYLERKALDWMLGQDSSYSTIQQVANYVKWLCGMYYLQAQAIIDMGGGGQSVTPVSPSPLVGSTLNWIEVRKADFANATDYVDDRLQGKDLSVLGSWLGSRLIEEGIEWESINGGGVRILIDGFDSSAFDDDTIIFRIDINGEIAAGAAQSTYTYDLTTDATPITNLPTGTAYQIRNVVVKPNGYTYTWGSDFKFTDNWPEQPLAIDVDTKQVYTFMYIAGVGDVCVGQSLNIAL
jgi:hypothetical protein